MRRIGGLWFTPKIITTFLEGYKFSDFKADLIAGLTVAIIALPLAIALGIASGASPEQGLLTAIVGGFLISLFGGSRVQIGGPTGAFVVLVFNVIAQFGYSGLIIATVLAGCIMVVAGYLRFGQVIKFIPLPVVAGFTAGIAVIIATAQVKDFLGLSIADAPVGFINQWKTYLSILSTTNLSALAIGSLSVTACILLKYLLPRYPTYLIVLILSSLLAFYLKLPVETVGSRFPELSGGIPAPKIPSFSIELIQQLLPSAFAIAFLASIEALLSAVVADGLTGFRHRPNQELVGQGIANIASACFGGLPATGAIARTATNITAGAKTPVSGILHALFLLIFVFFGIDLIKPIPMSVLAGLLFLVAWGMSEAHQFIKIINLSGVDRLVLLITFLLTVFVDLTVAIGVGVSISSLLFMSQMSNSSEFIKRVSPDDWANKSPNFRENLLGTVEVFSVEGPIFFGVASELGAIFTLIGKSPNVIIMEMSLVPYLDITGAKALAQLISRCQKNNTYIVFSGLKKHSEELIRGFHDSKSNKLVGYAANFEHALALSGSIVTNI